MSKHEIEYVELCKELDEISKLDPQKGTHEYKKMQEIINTISQYEEQIYGGK